MGQRRWVLVSLVAAAVALAIAYGFLPRPVPVDAVTVSRGELLVTVEEEGRTRVKERFTVSAPVAGFLRRVSLEVGDIVNKGQTVATIDPSRSSVLDARARAAAEAAVSAARAALGGAKQRRRVAEAAAEYSAGSLERTRGLFDLGFAARDAMDLALSDAKRAEAELAAAEAAVSVAAFELEEARTALGYSAAGGAGGGGLAVRSPVDGRVLKVYRESEGAVFSADPLVDVGDARNLEVIAEVLSADAVRIKEGAIVLLERWGGEGAMRGKVTTVEPAGFTKVSSLGVEEQRVNVISAITSMPDGAQKIGDGFRVEARFVIWEDPAVLRLPVSSLFRSGEGWAVFVVSGGRARTRGVTIGHTNGVFAEVLSGVTEDESVISHPDDAIADNVRVRAR